LHYIQEDGEPTNLLKNIVGDSNIDKKILSFYRGSPIKRIYFNYLEKVSNCILKYVTKEEIIGSYSPEDIPHFNSS
jgi:hypothetical protein